MQQQDNADNGNKESINIKQLLFLLYIGVAIFKFLVQCYYSNKPGPCKTRQRIFFFLSLTSLDHAKLDLYNNDRDYFYFYYYERAHILSRLYEKQHIQYKILKSTFFFKSENTYS